jgi:hypothetical protein
MAMNLRLTDDETAALRARAEKQEARGNEQSQRSRDAHLRPR